MTGLSEGAALASACSLAYTLALLNGSQTPSIHRSLSFFYTLVKAFRMELRADVALAQVQAVLFTISSSNFLSLGGKCGDVPLSAIEIRNLQMILAAQSGPVSMFGSPLAIEDMNLPRWNLHLADLSIYKAHIHTTLGIVEAPITTQHTRASSFYYTRRSLW